MAASLCGMGGWDYLANRATGVLLRAGLMIMVTSRLSPGFPGFKVSYVNWLSKPFGYITC